MSPCTHLATERLQLRRFDENDLDNLFTLDGDPEVMRYITGGSSTAKEILRRQILPRFVREQDLAGVFGFWAAEQDGSFVGWFSLRPIDGLPGQATLGYRLRRAAWGQGLATEGGRLLVDRGFRLAELETVIATTYEENIASIGVMKKLGMQFKRAFRMDSTELAAIDTAAAEPIEAFPGVDVEYAVSRAEWTGP